MALLHTSLFIYKAAWMACLAELKYPELYPLQKKMSGKNNLQRYNPK